MESYIKGDKSVRIYQESFRCFRQQWYSEQSSGLFQFPLQEYQYCKDRFS